MQSETYVDKLYRSINSVLEAHESSQRLPIVYALDFCCLCGCNFEESKGAPSALRVVIIQKQRMLAADCKACASRFQNASRATQKLLCKTIEVNLLGSLNSELLKECEALTASSPLERKVFGYLVKHYSAIPIFDKDIKGLCFTFDGMRIYCLPQYAVDVQTFTGVSKSYRLDFLLVSEKRRDLRVGIEIDGHDFHEKTKEQAKKDKSRDRLLTQAGYRMFHFTGSEVFNDADTCLLEVLSWMRRCADESAGH